MKVMYTYINGEFFTKDTAKVSVSDRGFRFGDGVFEATAFYGGELHQWDLHMLRLERALMAFRIDAACDFLAISKEVIKRSDINDGILRIAVSRGEGGTYLPDSNSSPTIVVEVLPLPIAPKNPISLYVSTLRKISSRSIPVHVKTMQGVSSTLARMEADNNNCFEALLLDLDGNVCECSSSNIFWFQDDILHTPSLENDLVEGTVRNAVIRLSPFEVKEGVYVLHDLLKADEVFITNVAWNVLSVKDIFHNGVKYDSFRRSKQIADLLTDEITRNTSMG